jgi:chemotaxis methyl-accepting protein methylase
MCISLPLSSSKKQKDYKWQVYPCVNMSLSNLTSNGVGKIDTAELYNPELFRKFLKDNPTILALPATQQMNKFITYGINPCTFFFRNKHAQVVFEKVLLPTIAKDDKISVASVCCSTGKETYSFILWNWSIKDRLEVHGYDINPKSIKKAAKGIYEAWSDPNPDWADIFEGLKIQEKKRPYAIDDNEIIRFSGELRKKIKFSAHDIMKEKLPEKYNLALLMNVLYYCKPKGIERILSNVHDSLKEGGFLLCENSIYLPGMAPDFGIRADYTKFMEDISHLGFERQTNLLAGTEYEKEMRYVQLYRRINNK